MPDESVEVRPPDTSATATEIYRQIMQWLETGHGPLGSGRDILTLHAQTPTGTRVLKFRRRQGLGGMLWAEPVDQPGTQIHYDPKWNALLKIEALLKGDV